MDTRQTMKLAALNPMGMMTGPSKSTESEEPKEQKMSMSQFANMLDDMIEEPEEDSV